MLDAIKPLALAVEAADYEESKKELKKEEELPEIKLYYRKHFGSFDK